MQLNVRGISSLDKFAQLCTAIATFPFRFDVIALSEVKLNASSHFKLYNINGFTRFANLRAARSGGGVIVFVNSSLQVCEKSSSLVGVEKLSLTISRRDRKVRVLVYYRAPVPSNLRLFFDDVENEISTSSLHTILLGDINISVNNRANHPSPSDRASAEYVELLGSFGYSVTNNLPTRSLSGRTIDHFACNFDNVFNISNYTIEFDAKFTDHNIIISLIDFPSWTRHDKKTITRTSTAFSELCKHFPDTTAHIESLEDPEIICDSIVSAIHSAVASATTTRTYTVRHAEKINQWTSEKAIKLILEKDKILTKRRQKPGSKLDDELKALEDELRVTNKNDYASYVRRKTSTKDPKKMWRNLNGITGRSKIRNPISQLNSNGKCHTDNLGIANALNDYFSTCADEYLAADSPEIQEPDVHESSLPTIFLSPPSLCEVQSVVRSLCNDTAPGSDGITVRAVKSLLPVIGPLLVHLVAVIFSTGIFPSALKHAVVTPIYKTGDQSLPENHRPISMLSVLSRIIERILLQRLTSFVCDKHKKLFSHQFGFRSKCSTENAAIEVVNLISKALDDKKVATAVFMDLRKAFDIVDHKLLLRVLETFGIRGKANDLIRSFLTNRTQIVRVNGVASVRHLIKSGVIQGSCLGPFLFLLFVNAIGNIRTTGKLFLFADDAALVQISDPTDDLSSRARTDMRPLIEFFKQRKMFLNETKTKFMVFSRNRNKSNIPDTIQLDEKLTIGRVDSFKYLGLTINDKLDWSNHLAGLEGKLASANGILWKLRNSLPLPVKKQIYSTLLQTHLNFMSPIWGSAPCATLQNAQTLQNRALRNVYQIPRLESRVSMYSHKVESFLPIRALYVLNTAVFIFRAIHQSTHTNIVFEATHHHRALREVHSLKPCASRTNIGDRRVESMGVKLFNKLPKSIANARHHHELKWTLKCHLRSEKFISTCFNADFFKLTL